MIRQLPLILLAVVQLVLSSSPSPLLRGTNTTHPLSPANDTINLLAAQTIMTAGQKPEPSSKISAAAASDMIEAKQFGSGKKQVVNATLPNNDVGYIETRHPGIVLSPGEG